MMMSTRMMMAGCRLLQTMTMGVTALMMMLGRSGCHWSASPSWVWGPWVYLLKRRTACKQRCHTRAPMEARAGVSSSPLHASYEHTCALHTRALRVEVQARAQGVVAHLGGRRKRTQVRHLDTSCALAVAAQCCAALSHAWLQSMCRVDSAWRVDQVLLDSEGYARRWVDTVLGQGQAR